MKAHIGVDAATGLVHSLATTAANVADITQVALHTMAPDGSDMRMLVRGGLAMVAKHSSNQDAEVGKPRAARGPWCPIRTATRGSWRTARR